MSSINHEFRPINVRSASEHEYQCAAEFKNLLNQEYYPDDPPTPLEEQIQGWKNIPAFVELEAHAAWDPSGTKILAFCEVDVENTDDNEHLAFFRIEVLPEYRCRGLGRHMLKMLLPFAKVRNRRLLMVWASGQIPAAGIFLERIGARKGQESHINQLSVSEFDRDLMNRWLEKSQDLDREFEIGLWDGPVPEKHLIEMVDLMQALANDQPRDNLEMEDMKFTPQILQEVENYFFAKGDKRWILYSVDRAKGNFVGLTEVRWSPNRPEILEQGFTAVYPAYRNKGLGRWLKAGMMKKIIEERPEVRVIRTRNANSNAPMLKINQEMGFKPYIASALWQVEISQVEKYLQKHGSTENNIDKN